MGKKSTSSSSPPLLNIEEIVHPMKEIHNSGVNLSYEWRMEQLQSLKHMINDHMDEFCHALQEDLGKHSVEGMLTEIHCIQAEIEYAIRHLRSWMGRQYVPSPGLFFPCTSSIQPKPLRSPGVLIIGPFNYPLALTVQIAIGTLAAGNPTIIKPSELCPNVSKVLKQYCQKYFGSNKQHPFPALQVIEGGAEETIQLTQQPWGMIVFTGSSRVGRLIAIEAAKTFTPCLLELGGKCPCYVDYETVSKKDLEQIANRIIWAKTLNCGQTCVAPDYCIVHEKHVESLGQELVKALKQQFGTNPKGSELGRIVKSSSTHTQRIIDMIVEVEQELEKQQQQEKKGKEEEEEEEEETTTTTATTKMERQGKILYGGSRTCDVKASYVCPTIILNPPKSCRVLSEEIFGPILPILVVSSREEAIQLIQSMMIQQNILGIGGNTNNNNMTTPLALYVFTKSSHVFEQMMNACPAAAGVQNDAILQFGSKFLPVGGCGTSGYGRYHGKYSFDTFTHEYPIISRPLFPGSDHNRMRCHPYEQNFILGKTKGDLLLAAGKFLPDIPVLFRRGTTTTTILGQIFCWLGAAAVVYWTCGEYIPWNILTREKERKATSFDW